MRPMPSRSGGIGRRAGFKIPSWQQGEGSIPSFGSTAARAGYGLGLNHKARSSSHVKTLRYGKIFPDVIRPRLALIRHTPFKKNRRPGWGRLLGKDARRCYGRGVIYNTTETMPALGADAPAALMAVTRYCISIPRG